MSVVEQVRLMARGFSGMLGVWAHSLDTGETIEWNAAEVFPAASTIKLPILYEVFHQAADGRLRLADTATLRAEDIVPGSGVLKDLMPGVTLTVRDLATLMIVISDNTATNMLIDRVGLDAVNASAAELGLTGTRLAFKLFKGPDGPPRNVSTPHDLGRLMVLAATHGVLTPAACDDMLAILGRQHFTDLITRRIPDYDAFLEHGKDPVVAVASKSGSVRGTRNDVGLVTARGRRYVIAMMSKGCTDQRFYQDNEAALLLPQISAAIYQQFVPQP
jgi:beta-lactamase class A